MKDSEASKASEASKSSQASYASIASPPDFIIPKISFRGSENRPRGAPRYFRGDLGDPPRNLGEPRNNNQGGVAPLGLKIC